MITTCRPSATSTAAKTRARATTGHLAFYAIGPGQRLLQGAGAPASVDTCRVSRSPASPPNPSGVNRAVGPFLGVKVGVQQQLHVSTQRRVGCRQHGELFAACRFVEIGQLVELRADRIPGQV